MQPTISETSSTDSVTWPIESSTEPSKTQKKHPLANGASIVCAPLSRNVWLLWLLHRVWFLVILQISEKVFMHLI